MSNKFFKFTSLAVLLLAIPGYAFAGLSEKCFPGVECDSGKDYYGSSTGVYSCQTHIETIAANCAGKNNFTCENGCYNSGGGTGGTPTYCSESNQAFKTNSSGSNICGTVDDGDWTQSSGNLYRNTGNVGIGTPSPNSSAILDLTSTTKGLLLPRTTTGSISSPLAGLLIYDTNNNKPYFRNNSVWTDLTGPQGPQGPTLGIYDSLGLTSSGVPAKAAGDAGGRTLFNLGNTGIGTSGPVNKLDVEGGVAIGSTYSGTNAAPTNGLIIEGNVGIGTASPASSTRLTIGGSSTYTYGIKADMNGASGQTNYGIYGGQSLTINSGYGEAIGVYGQGAIGGSNFNYGVNAIGGYFYGFGGYSSTGVQVKSYGSSKLAFGVNIDMSNLSTTSMIRGIDAGISTSNGNTATADGIVMNINSYGDARGASFVANSTNYGGNYYNARGVYASASSVSGNADGGYFVASNFGAVGESIGVHASATKNNNDNPMRTIGVYAEAAGGPSTNNVIGVLSNATISAGWGGRAYGFYTANDSYIGGELSVGSIKITNGVSAQSLNISGDSSLHGISGYSLNLSGDLVANGNSWGADMGTVNGVSGTWMDCPAGSYVTGVAVSEGGVNGVRCRKL